jgi:excisionase family DNA binding protein
LLSAISFCDWSHMTINIVQNKTYSITQAAELCGINRVTLWRWIKAGKLAAYQTPLGRYRIKQKDLKSFIRKHLAFIDFDFPREPTKILIVDDDASLRKLIRRILSDSVFIVEEAGNGFDAGIKILSFMPSIVILDLFMPEIDGFEICRRIKSESHTRHIKIIALTGMGSHETKEKIMHLGADAYLEKPIAGQDLKKCIERLL